jgi:hypothetical protein
VIAQEKSGTTIPEEQENLGKDSKSEPNTPLKSPDINRSKSKPKVNDWAKPKGGEQPKPVPETRQSNPESMGDSDQKSMQ